MNETERRRFRVLALDAEVDINYANPKQYTPLLLLCTLYKGEKLSSLVQDLLSRKDIDVNCKTAVGWNALLAVCYHYHRTKLYEIIRLLLKSGIDVNATSKRNWNALLALMCNKRGNFHSFFPIVRALVESGLNINTKADDGTSAFICLFGFGRDGNNHYARPDFLPVARYLIDEGADVNIKDFLGKNALLLVCQNYNIPYLFETVRLLVDAKIDVNIQLSGQTAVHLLKKRGFKEDSKIIQLLLQS